MVECRNCGAEYRPGHGEPNCITVLQERLSRLYARIAELEAENACPYVRTSNEGTSYCALAEKCRGD